MGSPRLSPPFFDITDHKPEPLEPSAECVKCGLERPNKKPGTYGWCQRCYTFRDFTHVTPEIKETK